MLRVVLSGRQRRYCKAWIDSALDHVGYDVGMAMWLSIIAVGLARSLREVSGFRNMGDYSRPYPTTSAQQGLKGMIETTQ